MTLLVELVTQKLYPPVGRMVGYGYGYVLTRLIHHYLFCFYRRELPLNSLALFVRGHLLNF